MILVYWRWRCLGLALAGEGVVRSRDVLNVVYIQQRVRCVESDADCERDSRVRWVGGAGRL